MHRVLRSTGFRLTALAAGLFAICILALCVLIYIGLRDDMEDQLRDQIRNETRQLMGDYADDGLEELRHDISERLDRNPGNRLRYTLMNAEGITIFDRMELSERTGWGRIARDGEADLLILVTQLDDGYRLGVAADTRIVGEAARALRHAMFVILLPALLLSLVAGLFVSRRFLSRVERMKATAERVGRQSLSARMPVSTADDEFDSLAGTINSMLDRIEMLVQKIRYVSASIAHDLRTPLGHLRQRLERLTAAADQPELRQDLEASTQLLDDVLATFSSLLKIAELESGAPGSANRVVDLSDLASSIASTFASVAEAEGKTITANIQRPAPVMGDRQLLTQMLVNLVENALHHNPGPVDIEIATGAGDGVSWISVGDNGAGIPDSEFENVIRPFHRLDRSRSSPGSGLGLSLASSIARHHGGDLQLTSRRPGLDVLARFPIAKKG